jgi:lysyl-tRNA synthetase class 2
MRRLIPFVCREVTESAVVQYQGLRIDTEAEWVCWTVAEAYRRLAGWDPTRAYDADRFDMDMIERIEPALPRDRPVVLTDYPAEAAALAKHSSGPAPVAERWELYIGGLELANAFSELTDAEEQRRRFEECAEERRRRGATVYPMDERFLAALERGMPPAGGVALGFDRLVMLLADAPEISDVRPFAGE